MVSIVSPRRLVKKWDKTPTQIMRIQITMEMKLKGDESRFIRAKNGKFGLREWEQPKKIIFLRKRTLKNTVYQILKNMGKPMIAEELIEYILVPELLKRLGKNQAASLGSKLSAEIKKLGDQSLFVQIGKNRFGLREWGLDALEEEVERAKKEGTAAPPVEKSRPIVGSPMEFRGMLYEPTDKNGVLFLFSKIHEDLDMKVEAIKPTFPDAKCLRKTKRGWEDVWVGFEYKSSDFVKHNHDQEDCDIIVCWEDDWKDRPSALKVIELNKIIRKKKK